LPLLRNLIRRALRPLQPFRRRLSLSTEYVRTAPSAQNALDIFKGRWFSQLPLAGTRAGDVALFEDPRIAWAISEFGNLDGKNVLELGPLEGAHSTMLERAGAASVVSIEANPEAFLKCLIVKKTLDLARTHFLCGDFVEYLRGSPPQFDAAVACGVLYHMSNPVELIGLLSEITERLFLWTHYYDANLIAANRKVKSMFAGEHASEHAGFRHTLFRYEYWGSFGAQRFCGGSRPHAHWMKRDEILACLRHFGYTEITTSFEEPGHVDGPAFALVARKPSAGVERKL
jgi:Protein of unknown function (DUF1698)